MGAASLSHLGELPFYGGGPLRTSYGVVLPPGGKVAAYVHSSGSAYVDDRALELAGVVTTVDKGLARCRSGKGDTVVVLPGHTETVSGADGWPSLVAGTRIVGLGDAGLRPVINFSATTSQLAFDVANVTVMGMRFNVDGANGVVNALDATASGFRFIGNVVRTASGAALKATTALSLSAADQVVNGCKFFGTTTHNSTNVILIDTAVDQIEISDTYIQASATAASGLIGVTAAATGLLFRDLWLYNTHTASTATIAIGDVAADGLAVRVMSALKNDGVATAQGITFGTAALVQCLDCLVVDAAKASGITSPAVET